MSDKLKNYNSTEECNSFLKEAWGKLNSSIKEIEPDDNVNVLISYCNIAKILKELELLNSK